MKLPKRLLPAIALFLSAIHGPSLLAFAPSALSAPEKPTASEESSTFSLFGFLDSKLQHGVLMNLYVADRREIRLAELAKERATKQEVKDFANDMIEHHSSSLEEIRSIAKDEGFSDDFDLVLEGAVAMTMGVDNMVTALAMLSSQDFDKAFLNTMIMLHGKDLLRLSMQKHMLTPGAVRDHVEKLLPTMAEHLMRAKNLRDNLNLH